MTARSAIRCGIAAAALFALGTPLRAHAGATTVTAHKVVLPIKGVSQDNNSSDNDIRHTESVSAQELFGICTGASPTKNQGIYLFLDCANLNNNTIAAVQTSSASTAATLIHTIGTVEFQTPVVVTSTNHGTTLTSQKMPAVVHISGCTTVGSSVVTDITGIATVNFTKLGALICPNTVKITGTGSGTADLSGTGGFSGSFLVDQGTVINGNARSGAIAGFPAP